MAVPAAGAVAASPVARCGLVEKHCPIVARIEVRISIIYPYPSHFET
jgi:hypothetical protein